MEAAAKDEADRILRAARRNGILPPDSQDASGPPRKAPRLPASTRREIVPLRPSAEPWEAGEPRWTENGYGRYLSRPIPGGQGREGRWERLDPPPVDDQRGTALVFKQLRSEGERGLLRLRQMLQIVRGDE